MCTRFVQFASVLIDLYFSHLYTVLTSHYFALQEQIAKYRCNTFTIQSSVNSTSRPPSQVYHFSQSTMPKTNSSRSTSGSGGKRAAANAAATATTTPEPYQPSKSVYELTEDQEVNVKLVTYKVNHIGMGIRLAEEPKTYQVLVNHWGDRFRFCEPSNTYGIKVTAMVMEDMRRRKNEFIQNKINPTGAAKAASKSNDDEEDSLRAHQGSER